MSVTWFLFGVFTGIVLLSAMLAIAEVLTGRDQAKLYDHEAEELPVRRAVRCPECGGRIPAHRALCSRSMV